MATYPRDPELAPPELGGEPVGHDMPQAVSPVVKNRLHHVGWRGRALGGLAVLVAGGGLAYEAGLFGSGAVRHEQNITAHSWIRPPQFPASFILESSQGGIHLTSRDHMEASILGLIKFKIPLSDEKQEIWRRGKVQLILNNPEGNPSASLAITPLPESSSATVSYASNKKPLPDYQTTATVNVDNISVQVAGMACQEQNGECLVNATNSIDSELLNAIPFVGLAGKLDKLTTLLKLPILTGVSTYINKLLGNDAQAVAEKIETLDTYTDELYGSSCATQLIKPKYITQGVKTATQVLLRTYAGIAQKSSNWAGVHYYSSALQHINVILINSSGEPATQASLLANLPKSPSTEILKKGFSGFFADVPRVEASDCTVLPYPSSNLQTSTQSNIAGSPLSANTPAPGWVKVS